jgi:hypothetical protein
MQRPRLPCSAQLRQAPSHELSQQTPSTQFADAHSPAAAQVRPFIFRPLHCFVDDPATLTQGCPSAQSLSPVQVFLHAPAAHLYGEQSMGWASRHVP